MEFWVALQYGTAHAAALRDQKSAEFEANRLSFPADIPDCIAGSDELKEECDELIVRDSFSAFLFQRMGTTDL